jgi:hypothetical protein
MNGTGERWNGAAGTGWQEWATPCPWNRRLSQPEKAIFRPGWPIIGPTTNRDARATHLKFDELSRALQAADNALIRAEDASDEEMRGRKAHYDVLSHEHAPLSPRHADPAAKAQGRAPRSAN